MELFPAASYAVTVMTFVPLFNVTLEADQLVVPDAVPLVPFAAFAHVTCVTSASPETLPANLTVDLLDEYEVLFVGDVIVTTGTDASLTDKLFTVE